MNPRAVLEATLKPAYVAGRAAFIGWLERRNGIATEAEIHLEQLDLAAEGRGRYKAAGWFTLRRILPPRKVGPDDVFLDIGSGMGRVVFQAAAHYPFRRVLGVELSEELTRVAQGNIDRNRHRLRSADVELFTADVVNYEVPDDVTVIFFNNSVMGDPFATMIQAIIASVDRHPRRVRFIYGNPVEHEALMRTDRFRPVRRLRGLRPGSEWARSNSTQMYEVLPYKPAGPPRSSHSRLPRSQRDRAERGTRRPECF